LFAIVIIILDPTKNRNEQEPFVITIGNINIDGYSNATDGKFIAINTANSSNIPIGSR
jgi:hypothetical protein